MPYRPIAPQADDRRQKQAVAPIILKNCYVRQTPADDPKAARAPYFIAPTPGRTLRATMPNNVRGLFSEPGCRRGNLFVPNGSVLTEMSASYTYSEVGEINGGDIVQMRADREDLALLTFGVMRRWTGAAYTVIEDEDAPTFTGALAVVARRWVAANQGTDLFGWALAGDPTDWPANNEAQDQDLPDPLVGLEEIGGDLWAFGSKTTGVWQATGGAEEVAFAKMGGVGISVGLAGRDAFAPMGAGGMLLGHNRVVYGTQGFNLTPVPNLALEQALKALTASELEDCAAWSYEDGSKELWGINAGLAEGHVFDAQTGLWHLRSKYGSDTYDIDFAASAFGQIFVASRQSPAVWTLDDDVYIDGFDDNGDAIPIQRDMTLSIPSAGDVPVSRLVFDVKLKDVPSTGQGSSPKMLLRASSDGGASWDTWQDVDLPTPQNKFRPQAWALGLATAEHGMLVQLRITDPIGFAFSGVWINPTLEEMNA